VSQKKKRKNKGEKEEKKGSAIKNQTENKGKRQ
jgi:hypothetical protein